MFCRKAWHRLWPVSRKITPVCRNGHTARLLSSSFPVSGSNLGFIVLGGGSLTMALVYAHRTVYSDSVRYDERIAEIKTRSSSASIMTSEVVPAAEAEVAALVSEAKAITMETSKKKVSVAADAEPVTIISIVTKPVVQAVVGTATEPSSEAENTTRSEATEPALSVAKETATIESTVTFTEATVEASATPVRVPTV